jgi:CubicO group peptidase (beta-lactamase class C family)
MLSDALQHASAGVLEGAFPGGQIGVIQKGKAFSACFGRLRYSDESEPVTPETIYDLASLTKVVSTTALAMQLVQNGRLDLDAPIGHLCVELGDAVLKKATLSDLLSHSAGFAAWKSLYKAVPRKYLGTPEGRAIIFRALFDTDSVYEPGIKAIYSDLDMMLLGHIIEKIEGKPLNQLARERIFDVFGMNRTDFLPLRSMPDAACAPTQNCLWRGKELVGEVDDENAYAAGGVSGQAGLFGNADDLLLFCHQILLALKNDNGMWDQAILKKFSARRFPNSEYSFCLGFDGKSPKASTLPEAFGPGAIGHWGFTGTGMWIDPDKEIAAVLLTNRIHPTRNSEGINMWRTRIFEACF